MAFGRLERGPVAAPMSDINMTPLIDVMLVLLVIFMISAPLMTTGLPLDLPTSAAGQPDDGDPGWSLEIDAQGRLFLDHAATDTAALTQAARGVAAHDAGTTVRLRADQRVPYGRVAEVIGLLQAAGLTRVDLATQPPDGAAAP